MPLKNSKPQKSPLTSAPSDQPGQETQWFKNLIEHSPDLVARFDRQLRHLYVNPAICRATGLTQADYVGKTNRELGMPADLVEQWDANLSHVFDTGQEARLSFAYENSTGRRFYESLLVPELTADGGTVTSVVSFVRDITEHHQAEAALQELAQNMALAQRIANFGSWQVDLTPDLEFLEPQYWSDECYRIFGLEPQSVPITRALFYGRVHPADRERAEQLLRDSIRERTEISYEYRIIRPDGEIRFVRDQAKLILAEDTGQPLKLVGTVQDITEQKQAEATLRESEARFRATFEQAAVGMAHVSLDGRWLRVNQRLCQIVGYSRQELLARTFQQITHPADLELDLVYHRQLLAGQITTYTLEKRYLRKAGGSVWIELTVSLRRSETGEPLHVIAVVQDITARKEAQATRAQLEEQLRQAQKMESIGRLAGGVAHDFNNLLTVIQGYSEFMQKQLPADHPTRRSLTQILRASNSATALTRQLLAFSRKQHLTPTILDLNDLIDNLQKMLRRLIGEDIELVTELYAGLWSVLADPSQLEQVLLNLAINARDAMPTGGTLTISTANVDLSKPDPIPHREASSGPMVRLTVSDTGQGMDAQTREQIFEPFFTTKQAGQGTGLGLAMVYGTIKQSGGDIMVSSEVGQGSTFDIYLPSAEKQLPDHLLDPITKQEVPGGGETILLVEDESVVREITAVILEDAGYTLLVASRGEAALALNEHHPGSIDLLITDVIMPEMSGPALTEQLIVYHPALKVLYISGYPDEAINRYGLFANQVELLTKPFTPTALLTKVRQVLDGAAPAAA